MFFVFFFFFFFFFTCDTIFGVSLELRREIREPLLCPQGSPVSIRVARGSMALLSSQGRGIEPQDSFKGEAQGLSPVAAANPVFHQLVTVISASFSGCLWEVRNTVELGGASRDSSRFGAMEEGLISSCGGNFSVPLLF